ncbi:MAG: hypothetical protein HQL36_05305 [Alphaproteobacteria bacterium]|nr:hypothetical protein [Alphaproteobacteria bacterium]MBF0249910.1 hypothetical protein [Alphaproteobacteria bacterium]
MSETPVNPPAASRTSALRKLSMSYSQNEDRIVLYVAAEAVDFAFWITRRLAQRLWPPLIASLEKLPGVGGHADERARKAVLSMRHQDAVERTAISKEPLPAAVRQPADAKPGEAVQAKPAPPPVAEPSAEADAPKPDPLLIIGVTWNILQSGDVRLTLGLANGMQSQLVLNEKLVHVFCHLLAKSSEQAGWGLNLSTPDMGGSGVEAGGAPPVRH